MLSSMFYLICWVSTWQKSKDTFFTLTSMDHFWWLWCKPDSEKVWLFWKGYFCFYLKRAAERKLHVANLCVLIMVPHATFGNANFHYCFWCKKKVLGLHYFCRSNGLHPQLFFSSKQHLFYLCNGLKAVYYVHCCFQWWEMTSITIQSNG